MKRDGFSEGAAARGGEACLLRQAGLTNQKGCDKTKKSTASVLFYESGRTGLATALFIWKKPGFMRMQPVVDRLTAGIGGGQPEFRVT